MRNKFLNNYRYELLNDKEFELLARDLLQNEFKIKMQSFKKGKDKGIDARYSGSSDNEIIMQAKHYSNFNNLKSEISKEIVKVGNFNPLPLKYFLFTSLDLSVKELDEIFDIGKIYFKSKDNIYCKTKIDNLLSANKNNYIEEKYYKLWINSSNILKRILHNAEHGSSDFYEKKILKSSSLYVTTKYFNLALKKLKDNKFLIISGEPGVGKTTLAHNIIYKFLAKGFKLIYIDAYISEAEKLLSKDPKERQIIFFDDFLGRYIDNITNPKNTDSKIINFIDRIKGSKNKYFILTSRTVFLNSAKLISEKLNNSGLEFSEYELKLNEYNLYDKALILYNHLYFNDSTRQYLNFVKSDNFYHKIINHINYNPRIIEFITKLETFKKCNSRDSYIEYVLKCLDEPALIWDHAYKNEIDYEAKALLDTIFTLGRYASEEELVKKTFFSRLDYFKNSKNISTSFDSYNKSIRTLQNSLIITQRDIEKNTLKFILINPSLGDYLISFYNKSPEEKVGLIKSCISMHQIGNNFHPNKKGFINLSEKEIAIFKDKVILEYKELAHNSEYSYSSPEAYLIQILLDSFEFVDIRRDIYNLFKKLKIQEISANHFFYILKFLSKERELGVLKYIRRNILSLCSIFLESISDSDEIVLLKALFDNAHIDFKEFIEKNDLKESYIAKIEECIKSRIDSALEDSDFLDNDDLFNYYGKLDYDIAQSNFEDRLNRIIDEICNDIDENLEYSWADFTSRSDIESSISAIVDSWKTSENKINYVAHVNVNSEKNLIEKVEDLFT